jgi:hypothetical protein
MPRFARQCFGAHDSRVWIETLDRFAGHDTVVCCNEGSATK